MEEKLKIHVKIWFELKQIGSVEEYIEAFEFPSFQARKLPEENTELTPLN